METEIVLLIFNGIILSVDVFYHIIRLYYERKKVKELEKQTKMMEYYGPET